MLRFDITAAVLVACLFNFGDAAVTGWTAPPGITGGPSGTATGITEAEDTALNAVIATFTATGGAAITGYALVSGDPPFALDTSSGELTLTTALDYETATSHTVEVEATETGGAVGTATVVITVSDVNEAAPEFAETNYTVCATDGSGAGTSVTTFSATDADTSDTRTYSITSGNGDGVFTIATDELKVATGKTLDKDTTAIYTLVIHATDTVSPQKSGSTTYNVNVQTSCSSGAAALTMTFITLFLALISSLN